MIISISLFCNWSTTNWISFGSLIIGICTATFLIKNFYLGRQLTKTSLAINQFNIFNNELNDFITEAKGLVFKTELPDTDVSSSYMQELKNSNGISYITLFLFNTSLKPIPPGDPQKDKDLYRKRIDDFRFNVIFPLSKYYDRLLYYLQTIKEDEVLLHQYKKILYTKIERDILQGYFRISNNKIPFTGEIQYDLSVFKTPVYNPSSFYRINQFYIDNNLFYFKDLEFYIKTL